MCLFVLSPALFTPWGFGVDYTNHLWLVWHQGLAISHLHHPTLYLQSAQGIFEPFYAFYGGTLYATVGGISALLGNHAYPVYVASIGASTAIAYGGMWWLGRQLGLSRWAAHLPAFVAVTAAYYLTDVYARGAWPEFVAISAVPLFLAGALRLLTRPWRAWPVASFLFATVMLTGSHNITLLWGVILIGPVAVAAWIGIGPARPSVRTVTALLAVAALGAGINAWFLLVDLGRASDTLAWAQSKDFVAAYGGLFYFDNIGNVLDPLRSFPTQSTTYGLVIAAPVAAFALSLVLIVLAWPQFRRGARAFRVCWWILLATMTLLVILLVMPASWWGSLGSPFTDIQFPYRLAAWLLLAVAVQLVLSLWFARGLTGARRTIAIGLALTLVAVTVVQAAFQLYPGPRLRHETGYDIHPRTAAFETGPTTPPSSYYGSDVYGDYSLPFVKTQPTRTLVLPVPEPGQTRLEADVPLPPGHGPLATNVAAGPYMIQIEGVKWVGRTLNGLAVVEPERPHAKTAHVVVRADAGGLGVAGVVISILCLLGGLALIVWMALRPPTSLWSRGRQPKRAGSPAA